MSDIDEVKSRLDIVEIVGERMTLKKAGRHLKGLCPFHGEKTPSFIVSPDRQSFHCFGCGVGGSAFDFIMLIDHMEFGEALETLAAKVGYTLTKRVADSPEQKIKEKLIELNTLASEFFHYMLIKHPLGEKAREYLKNRKISDKSIETFMIGYSPNSWDALYKFLKKKGWDDELIEKAGLGVRGQRGVYDRFRGRVMFTLKDHRGKVMGFAGRVLDPTVKEAKYINSPETPIYNKSKMLFALDVTKDAIQKANEAIVMEGEIDAIMSFQAGVSNVVAIKGSAVTEEHVKLLKRYTDRLTFSLDSDLAGDAAARRGIDVADKAGFDMKVIILPNGKDPDEAVRENPVSFKKAIKEAVPIYEYFITSAVRRWNVKEAYGKKKASDELLPMLMRINNSIVQGHYVREVAKVLDISEETVTDGMKKVKVPLHEEMIKEQIAEKIEKTVEERMELYVLSLLLQGKVRSQFDTLVEHIKYEDILTLSIRRVLETLGELVSKLGEDNEVELKEFATSLPHELTPTLDEAYLYDLSSMEGDEVAWNKEWGKAVRDLRKMIIKRKMKDITEEMKKAEEVDGEQKEQKIEELQKKMTLLSEDLAVLAKMR